MDSLEYSIEIKEGVPWKDGFTCQHVNDVTDTPFKRVFSSKDKYSCEVDDLKSSWWYHVRLQIEYLGIKVYSKVQTAHTSRGVPSAPGQPKVAVIPVASTFDVNSRIPSRFDVLVSWGMSLSNGSEISSYQLQIKIFDRSGQVKAVDKKKNRHFQQMRTSANDAISQIISHKKNYNQWIQSRGRDSKQVEVSLRSRANRSPSPPHSSSPQRSSSRHLPLIASEMPPSSSSSSSLFRAASSEAPFPRPSTTSSSSTGWLIVYNNLNRKVKLDPPRSGEGEWNIRVRARNAIGWSPFSEVLAMNGMTHPSLFRLPSLPSSSSSSSPLSYQLEGVNRVATTGDGRLRPFSSPGRLLTAPPPPPQQQTSFPPEKVADEDEELWGFDLNEEYLSPLQGEFLGEEGREEREDRQPVEAKGSNSRSSSSAWKPAKPPRVKKNQQIHFSHDVAESEKSGQSRTKGRSESGAQQRPGEVVVDDDDYDGDNGMARHTATSSNASAPSSAGGGGGAASSSNKLTTATATKSNFSMKNGKPSLQRSSSIGSSGSGGRLIAGMEGSHGAPPAESIVAMMQKRKATIGVGTNKALDILMPFNSWD